MQRQLELGHSVGHKLISEALCFGGHTCTATDIAVAAGVAPYNICQFPGALDSLNPTLVYRAMCRIREMIENGIDCVKVNLSVHTALVIYSFSLTVTFSQTEKAAVPVVLVGGGSCLVDQSVGLNGAASLIIPDKHWVSSRAQSTECG